MLTLVALLVGTLFVPGLTFSPAASATDDAQRIDMSISTVEHLRDGVAERWEYWSGEPINPVARLDASGTAVNITNARVTLKVPKSQYLQKPQFVDSANADKSVQREDSEAWYVDYHFNTLRGGTAMDFPFPTSFLNKITPNGTTVDVSWTLYDGNNTQLQTVSKTLKAKSQQQYTAQKGVNRLGYPQDSSRRLVKVDGQNIWSFNYPVEDVSAVTNISQLRPDGYVPVTYWIGYKFTAPPGAPAGMGEYESKTVRFTETLPEGARLSEQAKKDGWTYVENSNERVATRTMATKDISSPSHCGYNKCINLVLDHYQGAINKDGSSTRDYKPYTNTVQVTLDPETAPYDAGSAFTQVAFGADEKQQFPGKTHTVWVDKAYYHTEYTYYDNKFYLGTEAIDPAAKTGNKMGHYLNVYQENNGSSLEGPKTGGITDFLTEVTDEGLDERLYYSSIVLFDAQSRNGGAVSSPDQRARVNAAKPHVYGVAADGSETKLTTAPLSFGGDNRFFINDVERKYQKLVIRFEKPLEMDNMTLRFGVDSYPLSSEVANWETTNYESTANKTSYKNSMSAKTALTAEPNAAITTRNESYLANNPLAVSGIKPTIYQSIYLSNTVAYENCEKKLPAGTELTPQNCRRIREYALHAHGYGQWGGFNGPVKNLRQIILLPPGVNYVKTAQTAANANIKWDAKPLEPKVVPNFNNTGKTALIYEHGDLSRENNKPVRPAVRFHLDTTLYAEPGPNEIIGYTLWDNNQQVTPHGSSVTDTTDMDGDGNLTERFLRSTVTTTFIPPTELVARKNVSLDKGAWFLTAPAQDLSGSVYYRLELRNAGITPINSVQVLDVLPHSRDTKVAPNEHDEYLPRKWDRLTAEGTTEKVDHSAFQTPFIGPVETVTALNGSVSSDAKDRFNYFYSTVPQGSTIADVRDGTWLTADQVTDWSKIRNFKAELKPGGSLKPGEVIHFVTPHTIPYTKDNSALESGSRAVNSVAVSRNGLNYLEANEVTSEIVKYSVDGIVFKDFNRDGNANKKEDRLSGYTVKLLNADTGAVATHPDGTAITAETNSEGHYSMDVYLRGNYRVQFTKQGEDIFTKLGNGEEKVASHVTTCHADGAATTDANAENCAADNAGANHLGLTEAFTLDPTNRHETRNAGIVLDKRDVEVRKVDQEGNKLTNGIEFKLCFTGALPGSATQPVWGGADHCSTVPVTDGVSLFKDVPFGVYSLTEQNVPAGIEGMTQPLEVTVSADGYAYDQNGEALPFLKIVNNVVKATVIVKKVDAENSNTTLAGAVFTLTKKDDPTKVYTSDPTGADGVATFTGVLYGDYTLAEKTAPTNYSLSTEQKTVTVRKHQETIEVGNFTNAIFKGTIKAKKVDADTNQPIAGATFGLFKVGADGQTVKPAIAQQVSGSDGIIQFTDVPFGSYKLGEITPAAGYLGSTTEKAAAITTQGQIVDLTGDAFTNTVKKGSITLKKVDFDDQTTAVEGVTFSLFAKTGDSVAADATATVKTAADGTATFANVRYGTYVVRETATKDGYVLESGEREVTIDTDGQQINLGTVTNKLIVGTVKVAKTDDSTPANPLPGVKFGLFPVTGGAAAADPAFEATTDAAGVAQFDRVTKGTYELREISTVAGHNLNTADKRTVTINARDQVVDLTVSPIVNTRIRGDVLLQKVDAKDPANPLAGVEFGLYAKSADGSIAADPAYRQTTGDDGSARFTGVLFGTYQLKEITPKLGYNPSPEVAGREIIVDTEGKVVDLSGTPFVNKVITSTVTLTKHDKDTPTLLLGGVDFSLYPVVDGVESTVAKYNATTNPAGVATFTDVEFGAYKLRETKTLINYVPTDKAWDVAVAKEGETIAVGDDAQGNIANTLKRGSVVVSKVSVDDGDAPLKGARFALKQGDVTVQEATTDASGKITFENVIYGEYTVVETAAPDGFVLDAKPVAVSITEQGQVVTVDPVSNRAARGTVTLTKVDGANKAPLAGAVFELVKDDQVIDTQTADAAGVVTFANVRYGSYTVREKTAPNGYVAVGAALPVTIDTDKQVINLGEVENRKIVGSAQVKKVDAETGEALAGVEFALYPAAADPNAAQDIDLAVDPAYTAVTNEEGVARFESVEFGRWILVERQPIEGYNPSPETAGRVIVIEKDGETVSAGDPFTNTKIRADITLTKVDKAGKPLAGAKFALRDKDGKTVQEAVSAANGLVVFERVAYGTYTVVETAAPAGYKLTDKATEVKVAVEGQTVDAGKIINERTPAVALSVTGTDISLTALAGGAALVLGVILLGVRRRKQSA